MIHAINVRLRKVSFLSNVKSQWIAQFVADIYLPRQQYCSVGQCGQ